MRVLLIEDDPGTREGIEIALGIEGMTVNSTDLGEEGVDLGKRYPYDIILLDLNLPDMSGYEVLRTLRMAKVETPIMIVSGLAGVEDKVRGFGYGADDYLTKPFHVNELIARIVAIVRRANGRVENDIVVGDLTLNINSKTVTIAGAPMHLTHKMYQLLEVLVMRQGITLTKDQILNHLYGGRDEPELKIIDVFICKLRKSLKDAGCTGAVIDTVWGRGYRLIAAGAHDADVHPPMELVA